MATATLELDSKAERANYDHVTRLLIEHGTSVLRETFDFIVPTDKLKTELCNSVVLAQLKEARLTKLDWETLYPFSETPVKSSDFDVTLLCRVLRTICNLKVPPRGWDSLPDAADASFEADITRIKFYRNTCMYGHVTRDPNITVDELKTLWQEIGFSILALARRLSPQKELEYKEAIGKLFVASKAPKDGKEHHQTVKQTLTENMLEVINQDKKVDSAETKLVKNEQSVSIMKGNQRRYLETGIALAFLSVLATTAIIGLAKSFPTQIYPNFFSGEVRREESTQDRWVAEKSKLRYKRKISSVELQNEERTSLGQNVMFSFNDPKWKQQWYLNRGNGRDMNVMEAWRKGYTGKGIVVAVVDDGVNGTNSDLTQNIDIEVEYDALHENPSVTNIVTSHGTMCAGVIAAAADNHFCGVGVAYNASIGGIRIFDKKAKRNDAVEARAFAFKPNYIDIYSSSWGPADSRDVLGGPGPQTLNAIKKGIEQGRHGRGSIYVFSGGNGGLIFNDVCAYNGYVNSMYTIGINSVDIDDNIAKYTEKCSAILASTYSRDHHSPRNGTITTSSLGIKACVDTFSGTSASAAMASGIIALVLQSNKNLTWRDVQHLVVRSSRPSVINSRDWVMNAAKLYVSSYSGFGLMDAGRMVEIAEKWKQVPKQIKCSVQPARINRAIPSTAFLNDSVEFSGSCDNHEGRIRFLEHVQVIISFNYTIRGAIEVVLSSPEGTNSEILPVRRYDYKDTLKNWVLLSVQFWGEDPYGQWKISLRNGLGYGNFVGTLYNWTLILHGTSTDPLEDNPHVKPGSPSPSYTTTSTTTTTTNRETPSEPVGTTTGEINYPSTSSTAGSFKTSTIAKSRPTEYRTDSKHSVSSNHDAEETVGLTSGEVAGIVIGTVLLVIVIVIILNWCLFRLGICAYCCCLVCLLECLRKVWNSEHDHPSRNTGVEPQPTNDDHWV